jgi:hypothetical protein
MVDYTRPASLGSRRLPRRPTSREIVQPGLQVRDSPLILYSDEIYAF